MTGKDSTSPSGIARKIALAIGALVVALALGEAIVRASGAAPAAKTIAVSDPDNVYRLSTNPILGFELKPDYRNDDPDPNSSFPRTNAHGQRDIEREIEKPPGARRIVLLGDSVVEGHGIMDVEATMSRQLEARLGEGTEVLNFGVSGYCTRSEIELLETRALAFDPDVVILVFVENDFRNFNQFAFRLESAVRRPAVVERLFLDSHLFRLAALELDLYGFGAEANPARWNDEAVGDRNVVDGLERFAELARSHEFLPLIAIWPRRHDGEIRDGPHVEGDDEALLVERLARTFGLRSFRLSGFLRDSGIPVRELYLTGDDIHPSPTGCRVAAEALRTVLADLDRFAPAPPPAERPDEAAVAAASYWEQEEEPNSAKLHNNIGRALREEGRLDEAMAEFEKALELDPTLPEAHFNVGFVRQTQGRLGEAKASYLASIRNWDENPQARNNLGLICLSENALDEAEVHLRRALVIDPDYGEAHLNLGNVLLRKNELVEARQHYQRALALKPGDATVHNNLANTYSEPADRSLAIEHYRRALELRPDYFSARYNLGLTLERAGDRAGALREFEAANRLQPGHGPTRAALERLRGAR